VVPTLRLKVLSNEDVEYIHEASLRILEEVGVQVPNAEVADMLKSVGCEVNLNTSIVKIPESIVVEMVRKASKNFTIYSRNDRRATFGDGKFKVLSSGGMMNVIDPSANERRAATLKDTVNAVKLGDALENIDIVGSLFVPQDVPTQLADVYMHATLIKYTSKPFFAWIYSAQSAEYILRMWTVVTGEACGKKPLSLGFFEPISPLKFSPHSLPILKLFAEHRIPVCFAPMVMASATGPATLAGTLALENTEILAGVVIAEVLGPGTPILYGGIPHILDQRTGNISFGSPEQGLMAIAMVQIGEYYGFTVHVNVGLTDSKSVDFQSGAEKAATMVLGALAGAELSGHQGIIGADVGGSLEQLVADDEVAGYVKRLLKGFKVEDDTVALDVIKRVGVGGSFLSQRHTMTHIRSEFWLPKIFNRLSWEVWKSKGSPAKLEEIRDSIGKILSKHEPERLDPSVEREIDRIVEEASKSLVR
jgi:trimethylamine--corrinoid protein Co-methyltransferase